MTFKVGDKVKFIKVKENQYPPPDMKVGDIGIIKVVMHDHCQIFSNNADNVLFYEEKELVNKYRLKRVAFE